jgi:hypothetical protein
MFDILLTSEFVSIYIVHYIDLFRSTIGDVL